MEKNAKVAFGPKHSELKGVWGCRRGEGERKSISPPNRSVRVGKEAEKSPIVRCSQRSRPPRGRLEEVKFKMRHDKKRSMAPVFALLSSFRSAKWKYNHFASSSSAGRCCAPGRTCLRAKRRAHNIHLSALIKKHKLRSVILLKFDSPCSRQQLPPPHPTPKPIFIIARYTASRAKNQHIDEGSATRIYYVCSFAFSSAMYIFARRGRSWAEGKVEFSASHPPSPRSASPARLRADFGLLSLSSDLVDVSTKPVSPFELVSCTHVSSFGLLPPFTQTKGEEKRQH